MSTIKKVLSAPTYCLSLVISSFMSTSLFLPPDFTPLLQSYIFNLEFPINTFNIEHRVEGKNFLAVDEWFEDTRKKRVIQGHSQKKSAPRTLPGKEWSKDTRRGREWSKDTRRKRVVQGHSQEKSDQRTLTGRVVQGHSQEKSDQRTLRGKEWSKDNCRKRVIQDHSRKSDPWHRKKKVIKEH